MSSVFPIRGQPDSDRDYRHPRTRAERVPKRDPNKGRRATAEPVGSILASPGQQSMTVEDEWALLPPLNEVIEAVDTFTCHYFQLGFIPKQRFPERLAQDHLSVSPFLLLTILSVSARFTPSLSQRFSSGVKAAETFMEHAQRLAITKIYDPSLETCQAFYLLSISQQGSGWKNPSYVC